MKPTLMDKMEKSETSNIQVQALPTSSNMKSVAYAAFGLTIGLLVALVVLSVLIYGNTKDIKRSNDVLNTVEYLYAMNPRFGGLYKHQQNLVKDLTFHIMKTGQIHKENIVINGQEEIIISPEGIVIYDFSKGWMIAKLSSTVTHACYVSQFDMTEGIEKAREALQKDKSDVFVTADETKIHFISTGKTVSRASLSPSAARMCENSTLIWFTEVRNNKEHGIEKRSHNDDNGDYNVLLPDGRTQTVTYTVNGDSGYVADVQYEGRK